MQKKIDRIKFSIILVTFRRCNQLEICLDEIFSQLSGRNDWEVLLVVNGEDEKTWSWIKGYHSPVRVFQIKSVTPAQARNTLIEKALGKYLCFLDDDSMPGENYFKTALEFILVHPEVDVFGGPDTVFPDASVFEQTVGMALLSPMATAVTRLRHTKRDCRLVMEGNEAKLILCNLWSKRSIFSEDGLVFDKRFFRNEENILLWQLQDFGKNIKYLPFLYVYHRKKKTLGIFIKAIVQSGKSRLKGFFFYPRSLDLMYFIPMIFVLYVMLLPFVRELMLWIPFMAYLVLLVFFTIKITMQQKGLRFFLRVFVMQMVINISYGAAFWVELFNQLHRLLHKWGLKFYKKRGDLTDSI